MTVSVIRKQSGQANEVTGAMLQAAEGHIDYAAIYKAMEAARIAECGEIERIEVRDGHNYGSIDITIQPDYHGIPYVDFRCGDNQLTAKTENILPLAEALLELGKQMKGAV